MIDEQRCLQAASLPKKFLVVVRGSSRWMGGVTEEDSDLHNALRAIVPGTL